MRSPTIALAWEIWQRGRRPVRLVLACLAVCAFINLVVLDRLSAGAGQAFVVVFGLLMVLSFLLLMGIFNYTEFSSTREWNGFPYRLFVFPVRTWRLVALPMLLGVAAVELVYVAWIKLVWTHEKIVSPEWFALVLGVYVVCYQTTLWSLAGFRITRLVVLSLGGVSSVALACVPLSAQDLASPWLSEKRLGAVLCLVALMAFAIAWTAVSRQRCAGGLRRSWIKTALDRILDVLPRRTRPFDSPAAAQFWYEWRRSGFLLPVCTALVLIAVVVPTSWLWRHDPKVTVSTLVKTLAMPVVLAFAIGKGFVKPEFWTTQLSLPTFIAVKPFSSGDFVVAKMKVAALSVAIAWLLVISFAATWLPLWADTKNLDPLLAEFRAFYPHSWPAIAVLSLAALMVLSWRCLISGLWAGLSGSPLRYVGSLCLQVIVPSLALAACGIWSDSIDEQIRVHPESVKSLALTALGWALALAVILKMSLAVISWSKLTRRRAWQYLLLWSAATLGFVMLGILARPPFDSNRLEHLFVLAALLVFPFARPGFAPLALAKNRHH